MKSNVFLKSIMAVMVAGLIFASCSKRPSYDIGTADLDMVYTHYDNALNFNDFKTYSLADSLNFDESKFTPEEIAYLKTYYQEIFDRIDNNMQLKGYQKVDTAAGPDLGVGVSIITRTSYVVYWGWWYGYPYYKGTSYWGYPGYGYWYPWSPTVSSYEEGAIVIEMADLKHPDLVNKTINMAWASLIGGVLANNNSLIDQRLIQQIDQSFEQSPYLKTN